MNMSSNRRNSGPDLPGAAWGLPRELDDLLDRLGRWTGWDVGARSQASRWMPTAEEDESGDAYRVRVELPGIPREKVSVDVEGRQLCVRGDLGDVTSPQDSYLTHRSGSFLYRTSLPADADVDHAQADLSDGVLTVKVPRSGMAERRPVPIGGGAGHEIPGETVESQAGPETPIRPETPTRPEASTGPATPTGSEIPTSSQTPPGTEPRIDSPEPGQHTDGM